MTNAQAVAWAAFRDAYSATGYEMPEEHRHSPAMVIGLGEFWHEHEREYVGVVIRLHPDGRREAITDPMGAFLFAEDARKEGRRI